MTKYRPDGWPTLIPRMFSEDVSGIVGFLKRVFSAKGQLRAGMPTELWIGDSLIMISDGGGLREPMATFLYVYVENADATYLLALDAGAVSIEEPAEMAYGDRRAMVRDPWGNTWQIATHRNLALASSETGTKDDVR